MFDDSPKASTKETLSSILYLIELNFAVVFLVIESIHIKAYTVLSLCILIKISMFRYSDIFFLALYLSRKKYDIIIVEELWICFMSIQYDNLKLVTRLSEPKMLISTGVLWLLLNMDIEVRSSTSYP